MKGYELHPIGVIKTDNDNFRIELDKKYAEGLEGLEGFSHAVVLWWFSLCDSEAARSKLTTEAPYKCAPESLGVFATRSSERPNPIALDVAQITYIDIENAVVGIGWTEAADGSPVLDIKPYEPSLDRVESPEVPAWCAHWPRSLEQSAEFDWEGEMGGR